MPASRKITLSYEFNRETGEHEFSIDYESDRDIVQHEKGHLPYVIQLLERIDMLVEGKTIRVKRGAVDHIYEIRKRGDEWLLHSLETQVQEGSGLAKPVSKQKSLQEDDQLSEKNKQERLQ